MEALAGFKEDPPNFCWQGGHDAALDDTGHDGSEHELEEGLGHGHRVALHHAVQVLDGEFGLGRALPACHPAVHPTIRLAEVSRLAKQTGSLNL